MFLCAVLAAFQHTTVLASEAVDALALRPDGTYVDCTAGGGGHSARIAAELGPDGRLFSFDRDADAIAAARAHIASTAPAAPVELVHAPFSRLVEELAARGVSQVDGILADLGVSSPQLDHAERGFSFRKDGPLDMRMDRDSGASAADLVASLSETELADVIYRYGDERDSRRIARAIVARRATTPFTRTADLAAVIAAAKPKKRKARGPQVHPATKSFQALRIATNGELDELDALLHSALDLLVPGGRLAVITFHSGEDRPVKQTFASWAKGPALPPAQAIYSSHGDPLVRLPHPKGIAASSAETAANPRARSARLRVAEKLQ
ncbi:MAG: 16S rRNA (cytosine(1402)-N(4))-methyltransferase RsmH [Deltaproteobacteria bacterium]|nr:16S rRNA (cytosine(1402)-N(4))-methyltransferase RsmH [Deltaproteobacteria bacterium]